MEAHAYDVLLVEDSPIDVLVAMQSFKTCQLAEFSVSHVETLEAARELLSTRRFDAILLDLSLPDSNSANQSIESIRFKAGVTPIFLFTALDEDVTSQLTGHAGVFKKANIGECEIATAIHEFRQKRESAGTRQIQLRELRNGLQALFD